MQHTVLARKWRPKNFADLVGQQNTVKILTNIISNHRLHHAYLLTGTRGVGKTTTSINLSSNLAVMGKKILLVDVDPQGNAGSGLGLDVNSLSHTTYDVLLGEISAREEIVQTEISGLNIIPANINLSGVDIDLITQEGKEFSLKRAITPLRSEYDFIIIDCPPSLGLLTLNALSASDGVIITLQTEYFALE